MIDFSPLECECKFKVNGLILIDENANLKQLKYAMQNIRDAEDK